jgi:hypothetical protein
MNDYLKTAKVISNILKMKGIPNELKSNESIPKAIIQIQGKFENDKLEIVEKTLESMGFVCIFKSANQWLKPGVDLMIQQIPAMASTRYTTGQIDIRPVAVPLN